MTTTPDGRSGDPDDVDARFADIVSRWNDPPDEARESPDLDDLSVEHHPDGPTSPGDGDAPPQQTGDLAHLFTPVQWRVHEMPEEDEDEGYEPPPPAPLPSPLHDWQFWLAMVGLIAGPVWLLGLVFLAPTEHSLMWMAGALTVTGFVALVLRQPAERDEDDRDDGARV